MNVDPPASDPSAIGPPPAAGTPVPAPAAAPVGAPAPVPAASATTTPVPPRSSASAPPAAVTPQRTSQPLPARRGGATGALALVLAVVALLGTAYVGWRQWRVQSGADESPAVLALRERTDALQRDLGQAEQQRAALAQQLADTSHAAESMRGDLRDQVARTRDLQDAVARLSETSLSGRSGVLVDEAAALLRLGQQRYQLAHDAEGAAAAFAQADQALATLDDPAYAPVRQGIQGERDALIRSAPRDRAAELDAIGELRVAFASLPLKPLDAPASTADPGWWARVRHALSGVIAVRRDNGAPLAVADARLARDLAALDLAQANAGLLAYDGAGAAQALHRADATLMAQFDADDPAVQRAHARLNMLAEAVGNSQAVDLGGALKELRDLRAVHAIKPAPAGSAPAPTPAGTGSAPAPAAADGAAR